ncbi:hypothetical protein ON010_g5129 [Phytophthora cinnamomi]|nr:hypothetical protein ON010_g5129 [Phytophthora cinnamomi]
MGDGAGVVALAAVQIGLPTLNPAATHTPTKSSTSLAGKPLRMTTNPCTLSWRKLSYTVDTKKKNAEAP